LLSRPIEVAVHGYPFTGHSENAALYRWKAMNDAARSIFGCRSRATGNLEPCPPGAVIRQPDLAKVLELVSRFGRGGFYNSRVSKRIAAEVQKAGGILTAQDFLKYQARERTPITGRYRDTEIVSAPPPSAGGATIVEMFRYAQMADDQAELSQGYGAARTIHALAYGMSLAFADRAEYFGDPDQIKVPLSKLLSDDYLRARWKTFDASHAKQAPGSSYMIPSEGNHTTSFAVMDADGNAVSVTTTINDDFGSGFVAPGTGIVMNDEMDDFSAQPGVPNMYGLVGSQADAIAPLKRPLSSMSPTIVRDLSGNARIAIGAQGGPRITTAVFQALIDRLRFGMSLEDALQVPRFHEQWKPDLLTVESNGFGADTIQKLKAMGWKIEEESALGRMAAIERFPNGRTWGVVDHRTEGSAVAE